MPVNYEETAKQLASDFTIQWAFAYRSNNNKLLETLLDDYDSMIRDPNTAEPRNSIVSAWNNDHSSYAYYWYTYVSGPTVSSVMAKDNYVEGNAVYLTIDVSLIGTIQRYSTNDRSLHGSPRSVNDRATYEMYYDSDGWHFETANLRLS